MRAGRLRSDALETVRTLLGRPFAAGEAVVVKPGNEANVLANALLAGAAASRAIFLYAPLPKFLASVASKGMWGRIWGRRLYALLRGDHRLNFGLSEAELFTLTDLQVSGLAWLVHRAEAVALLAAFPDRVRTLDSETFLARRADALFALGRHFGLALDKDRAKHISAGPAFKAELEESRSGLRWIGRTEQGPNPTTREEIEMVSSWIGAVAQQTGLPINMPSHSALLTAV